MPHLPPVSIQPSRKMKFITAGEIMLRLSPPHYATLRAASSFDAAYGGSEANIALALADLGVDSTFFSVVPDNMLGKSAIRTLRASGVHCSPVILSTPAQTPTHRLGTYYLETGYGIRPSRIIYDRRHSALAEYDFSRMDTLALLKGYDWLHLSGITPALSPHCRAFTLQLLEAARQQGMIVSFDGNYRSTLWTWEEARDFCTLCLPYITVLFGIEPYHLPRDVQNPAAGDWKDDLPPQPDLEQQDAVFRRFAKRYPNLQYIARHVRYVHSGSENSLKAFLWHDGHTFESKLYTFPILDRVGSGDAFAAGLIYALMHGYPPAEMIRFAVASSVIKHTIHGDANLIDDVQTIRQLADTDFDIRR